MTQHLNLALGLLVAGSFAACSDGTAPGSKSQVTFNVSTTAGAPAGLSSLVSDTVTAGSDSLVLDQVELVLRDIRFKRLNDDACENDGDDNDDDSSVQPSDHGENGDDGNEDACETFNAGPFLLDLPLGPGVDQVFTVAVDTGTFDELRIRLHKPEDDGSDPADMAFLAAHPEFAQISIRATGSFNGAPFVFTSDLNADQEMQLVPPLVVSDGGANVDVTLKVDVATWFADGSGGLVNPATAAKGGANDNLVRDNIRNSFDAFQDENHDGEHDDHDD